LVSDLVPVDHKVMVGTTILPGLLAQLRGGADVNAWLDAQLAPLGEDPRGLVRDAAAAYFDAALAAGEIDAALRDRAAALF